MDNIDSVIRGNQGNDSNFFMYKKKNQKPKLEKLRIKKYQWKIRGININLI